MAARITVLLGPPSSGKTHALLGRYRAALRARPAGAVWIAPTHRSAADIRVRLLDAACTACLGPAVLTFAQFVDRVLAAGDLAVRPLSEFAKREVVRGLIEQAAGSGELAYYGAIAHTAGFVDRVAAQISEWKRLEIWPEHLRAAAGSSGLRHKDRDLLLLYEQYQRRLAEGQFFDAEGRFWMAREALKQGQQRPFESVRLVVVDGFSDFTRTQHEILRELAAWVDAIQVSLPHERETSRGDLFAKSSQTLGRLHQLHPGAVVEEWRDRRPTGAWPAWEHVERELFKNPRHASPAADAGRIEIVAAAGALDELQQIGRRIKRLLVDGDPDSHALVRPADIAVVFRSLTGREALVREAFDGLGLPYALDSRPALAETRSLAALRALLALERDDWPFRGVLSALLNSCLRPDWPEYSAETLADAELVIRRLQTHRGRAALLEGVERRAARLDRAQGGRANAERDRGDREAAQAARAMPLLSRIAATLGRLPRRDGASEWARALARLADEMGIRRAPIASASIDAANETAAWDTFLAALAAMDEIAPIGLGSGRQWTLDEACTLVDDLLAHETVGQGIDETGRVRVLSASSIRALSVPYLFLADLSEKSFPPADRDDRLYSEAENRRLRDAGLPIVLRGERSQEEMLLFYEAVTRAERRLCLSYPGLDEKGNPLLPSPYLAELEHSCGAGRIARAVVDDLSPIPTGDSPASLAEWRVMGVDQAARGRPELLAALLRDAPLRRAAANVSAGLRLTHDRSRRDRFGPYEGMLAGDAAAQFLRERYSDEHLWSASELEQYGQCPFKFFAARILDLAPLDELELDIDYMGRGSIVHEVLAELHARVNAVAGGGASPASLGEERLERLIEDLLEQFLGPRGAAAGVAGALVEVNRRQVRRWLAKYGEQHAIYDAGWGDFEEPPTARLLEFAFGEENTGEDAVSQGGPPVVLEHAGQAVLLRGRIDRVDVGRLAGRAVFVVLDYKTGAFKAYTRDAILSGAWLQPTIYALAAEQALAANEGVPAVPWRTGYWFVAHGGMRDKSAPVLHECAAGTLAPTKEWRMMRHAVAARVVALATGVRTGQFPMASVDEECTGHCEFATICRVHQVRALDKPWQPPRPQCD